MAEAVRRPGPRGGGRRCRTARSTGPTGWPSARSPTAGRAGARPPGVVDATHGLDGALPGALQQQRIPVRRLTETDDRPRGRSWTDATSSPGSAAASGRRRLAAAPRRAAPRAVTGEASRPPHRTSRPKAKRAIHICLVGGAEPPRLVRLQARARDASTARRCRPTTPPDIFFGQVGLLRKTDWEFRRRGQSGLWVSDLFPHLAGVADELTVIRSMVAETANHTPALFEQNSGFRFNGFPVAGQLALATAWAARPTTCRRSSCCPTAAASRRRRRQLVERLPAGAASGRRRSAAAARADRRPVPARSRSTRPPRRRRRELPRASSTRPHLDAVRRRRRPRGPDPQLRAGRADAARRARGRRPRPRAGEDPRALRPRPPRDGRLRPRAACSPAGCWSAACGSCSSSRGGPFAAARA